MKSNVKEDEDKRGEDPFSFKGKNRGKSEKCLKSKRVFV